MRYAIVLAGVLGLAAGQGYIGRLDTIGGTTYDWQNGWQAMKYLAGSPGHGMHAVWMWSAETSGASFTDRNLQYNYYDYATRAWKWIDPDYMQSGIHVFPHRAGYGNVDPDPATGAAVINCHYTGTPGVVPKVARDAGPGQGAFEYADGEAVFGANQWPRVALGQNGTIHLFMMTAAYVLTYGRLLPQNWPNFEPPVTPIEPSPGFPCHALAASKASGKVCLLWVVNQSRPAEGCLTTSSDNGATWTSSEQFLPPDAYEGDTVTSFHITSLYPWYDSQDRLHVVADVMPMVNDTLYIIPTQIWHWCADNTPQWTRIHIAGCDPANLQGSVGYNATYADRPCIGEGNDGRLYVTWEQFDSSNVEPVTNYLRAGVWVSSSPDNGLTWSPGVLLTERNTVSHRFPSIVDRMLPGGSQDTVCISYMMDLQAGFYVQGDGDWTFSPIVCQFIPSSLVGVKESSKPQASSHKRGPTILSGALSVERLASSVVFDAMGRRVTNLRSGVYFVRPASGVMRDASRVYKVILVP